MVIGKTNSSGMTAWAFILVNYPSGSTLTATNVSGKKDISATQRLYYVKKPSGSTQTCVLTITDGTQTRSETVSGITIGTARTVDIYYIYYLYNEGFVNQYEWEKVYSTTSIIHDTYLEIIGTSVRGGFQIKNTDDYTNYFILPTNYATLNIDMTQVSTSSNICLQGCKIKNSSNTDIITFSAKFSTNTRGVYQVSTTALSANTQYKIELTAGTSSSCKANIHKVWFE